MSNEELVLLIQQGDAGRLPELWAQIEGLARHFANRYAKALTRGGIDTNAAELFDDLFYGCGWPALAAAVETFDGAAGAVFSTWYGYYFKQEVYALRGWRWRDGETVQLDAAAHATSLNVPIGDDGDGAELQDLVPDPHSADGYKDAERRIFNDQLHAALLACLDTLPAEQREAITGTYFDGLTLRKLGECDGSTAAQIRQRQVNGLQRIRRSNACRKRLEPFSAPNAAVYSAGLCGGLQAFKTDGVRSTEQAAISLIEKKLR